MIDTSFLRETRILNWVARSPISTQILGCLEHTTLLHDSIAAGFNFQICGHFAQFTVPIGHIGTFGLPARFAHEG